MPAVPTEEPVDEDVEEREDGTTGFATEGECSGLACSLVASSNKELGVPRNMAHDPPAPKPSPPPLPEDPKEPGPTDAEEETIGPAKDALVGLEDVLVAEEAAARCTSLMNCVAMGPVMWRRNATVVSSCRSRVRTRP